MKPLKTVHFDFRAKIFVAVVVMSLVAFLASDMTIYLLITLLTFYLAVQGLAKHAFAYLAVALVLTVMRIFSGGNGITVLLPEMFLFMLLRTMLSS